jgi:hypothetical protein
MQCYLEHDEADEPGDGDEETLPPPREDDLVLLLMFNPDRVHGVFAWSHFESIDVVSENPAIPKTFPKMAPALVCLARHRDPAIDRTAS